MIKKRVLFIGIGFYDYEDAIISFTDSVTFDSNVTATGNSRNFSESVGIGLYVGVTQGGTTVNNAKIIERIYDVATKKYTTRLKLNKSFSLGSATMSHQTAVKPVFTKI